MLLTRKYKRIKTYISKWSIPRFNEPRIASHKFAGVLELIQANLDCKKIAEDNTSVRWLAIKVADWYFLCGKDLERAINVYILEIRPTLSAEVNSQIMAIIDSIAMRQHSAFKQEKINRKVQLKRFATERKVRLRGIHRPIDKKPTSVV